MQRYALGALFVPDDFVQIPAIPRTHNSKPMRNVVQRLFLGDSSLTDVSEIANSSCLLELKAAINEWRANNQEALADMSDPDRHLKPFWALGIQPGPIQVRAGDLCIFDTALFHSACPATDPYGDELLRAICIMSMAPRPHKQPSASTAANGSWSQWSRSTGTTSR